MKYSFDAFELDSDALLLCCDGIDTQLDPRCVELLSLLIEAWPGYCEPQQLLQQLWPRTIVTTASLSRLVSDCRKAIKKLGYDGSCIQTLHGKGYRLAPDVAELIFPATSASNMSVAGSLRRGWLLPAVPLAMLFISAFWLFPSGSSSPTNGPPLRISEAPGTVARVLWVDDNPDNNAREAAVMRQHNIAVYSVKSTEDALILLSFYNYDAVISDMGRSGEPLAGLRLLQIMRQQGMETPFYLYTIMPSAEKQQLIQQYGGQGLATKPEQLYHYILPMAHASSQISLK